LEKISTDPYTAANSKGASCRGRYLSRVRDLQLLREVVDFDDQRARASHGCQSGSGANYTGGTLKTNWAIKSDWAYWSRWSRWSFWADITLCAFDVPGDEPSTQEILVNIASSQIEI